MIGTIRSPLSLLRGEERERDIMVGLEVRSYYGTVYAGMGWVDHRPHDMVYDIVNSRDEAMTL